MDILMINDSYHLEKLYITCNIKFFNHLDLQIHIIDK